MKVLLIGEYSRLHNSLKEGLEKLGHQVVLLGSGDFFKDFPVDIEIGNPLCNKLLPSFIKKGIYKFLGLDLCDYEKMYRLNKQISKLINFHAVQLINEDALNIKPKFQIKYIKKLMRHNKNVFLLSCGDDYISVKHYLKNIEKYSILSPYIKDTSLKKDYLYSLKYQTKPYQELHEFLYKHIQGVIASDLDYHLPLKGNSKYLGLIPNPINTDKLKFNPLDVSGEIHIFHGVNTKNYIKKGNRYFDEALAIIKKKYSKKITITRTENLPYSAYIKAFNQAHIVLDQVFAYDQGYNALEAMAKGKVVFTGAEQEWLDYYKLTEDTVAINALPDTQAIVKKLTWLIENPNQIKSISKNARLFIEKEHHYVTIAKQYLKTWRD